jgi:hypothetical protein
MTARTRRWRKNTRLLALAVPLFAVVSSGEAVRSEPARLELAGVTVTPHVRATSMRYRRPSSGDLAARVQLFVRATQEGTRRDPLTVRNVRFDGQRPDDLLSAGAWAWHNLPDFAEAVDARLPAGALTVWTWNGKTTDWGINRKIGVDVEGDSTDRLGSFRVSIAAPRVWLSAVTFLGTEASLSPNRFIYHVANESASPVKIIQCRLYLPESNERWRCLHPQPPLTRHVLFPASGIVAAGDRGGAIVDTDPMPLTYGALEVELEDDAGAPFSLWAHLRIKREAFDISGGWVQSDTPRGNTLTEVPFLKTLRRMHVNTAQINAFPGYTDQDGPDGLYTRFPLKYFNRCMPLSEYDTDEILPRIHAVEFLGEPQYPGGRGYKTPQQVFEALLPYASSRLATSVTLSDESTWRYYAGLSDYPHYDAYRVTAPMADAWSRYDRWNGPSIRWGAPLETIGDMCRSLREMSRPGPTAYWSQGPHAGWRGFDGRRRGSPTRDEIRLQAYHALASRITSLYWFNLSLPSLLKYRDTIEELTRIGREIRLLEDFYLEGDAYRYQRETRDGSLDWDLSCVASPRGALLMALDLDYVPDPEEKVFRFKDPRDADFRFALPAYLRSPVDLFRVDADAVHDVAYDIVDDGVRVRDVTHKVAVYVATRDAQLRKQLEAKRQMLLRYEQSLGFNPAASDADFETLQSIGQ